MLEAAHATDLKLRAATILTRHLRGTHVHINPRVSRNTTAHNWLGLRLSIWTSPGNKIYMLTVEMCRRRTRNTSSSVTDSCLLKPSRFLSSCFRMYKIRSSAAARQTNHCSIAKLTSSRYTATWRDDSKQPLQVRLVTMLKHVHSVTEQLRSCIVLLTTVWTASPWWNNSFAVRWFQRWTRDIFTHMLIVCGKKM